MQDSLQCASCGRNLPPQQTKVARSARPQQKSKSKQRPSRSSHNWELQQDPTAAPRGVLDQPVMGYASSRTCSTWPSLNLRIYFPALVKLLSRYPNGSPGCLKKTFPPPSLEPLFHHRCRLSLGPGARPHVRIAPDLLPELSWPPRRRLASSWPECGRRLAHGL